MKSMNRHPSAWYKYSHTKQNIHFFSELGILIDGNKTVSWIKPGSVADFEERLTVGDKIVTVSDLE